MATTADLPMVECPACFKEFQWDDYYDIRVGHERECAHCGCDVIVTEVDQVVRGRFEVKGFEPNAQGKESAHDK